MSTAQDKLAGALVALGATITDAMDAAPGFVPCGTPSQVIIDALNTYAAADDAAITQTTPSILAFVEHVSDHRGVTAHEPAAVSGDEAEPFKQVLAFAAEADPSAVTPDKAEWLYRALASLA